MKSTWKAAVAALMLIGSIALAQAAPAQPAASAASDKTASEQATARASPPPSRTRVCHRPRGCAPHSRVERSRSHRLFAGASRWQNLSSVARRCAGRRPDAQTVGQLDNREAEKVSRRSARYRGGDPDQQQADLSGRRGVARWGYADVAQYDRFASVVQRWTKPVCQHEAHLCPAHRERQTAEAAGELSQAGQR